LHWIQGRAFFLLATGVLAACGEPDVAPAGELPQPAAGGLPLPAADNDGATCVDDARLSGELFGAVAGRIDWIDDVRCAGMPRPQGEGARLRFAGPHPSGDGTLAMILSLPDYERGAVRHELPTRLTVIEEGAGRFFATTDDESCWADILDAEAIDADRDRARGRMYCIRPLGEVNGSSAVTLSEFEFVGLIDWSAS
jgi:hypothetical protein